MPERRHANLTAIVSNLSGWWASHSLFGPLRVRTILVARFAHQDPAHGEPHPGLFPGSRTTEEKSAPAMNPERE